MRKGEGRSSAWGGDEREMETEMREGLGKWEWAEGGRLLLGGRKGREDRKEDRNRGKGKWQGSTGKGRSRES